MFRQSHSLKGAARSVGALGIAAMCQVLEDLFARLKKRQLSPSPELLDAMHQAVHALKELVTGALKATPESPQVSRVMAALHSWAGDQRPPAAGVAPPPQQTRPESAPPAQQSAAEALRAVLPETVRVATAKLDSVLFQAEDLLSARLAGGQRLEDLDRIQRQLSNWRNEWARVSPRLRPGNRTGGPASVRGTPTPARPSKQLSEFLEWNARLVHSISGELARLMGESTRDYRALAGMVDALLDTTKEALMLPFAQLLDLLPVVVRELSREQHKEVDLRVSGGEIAIDRRILEELQVAFIHLIRNAVDHGIETPEQRRRAHKPPRGTIKVTITQIAAGQVQIEFSDDGTGIDAAGLRAAAVTSGFRKPVEADTPDNTLQLVFESGVSTAPALTDISGRGLGLAIVREKVEKLGGTIAVESQPGKGACFRMIVPNTLARFRGVLVTAAGLLFMIPTATIDRVIRTPAIEIKRVENHETVTIEGQAVPLVRLAQLLEVPPPNGHLADPSSHFAAVVLGGGERKVALMVDEILFEQDVLMKPLGPQLPRVRNVAGATVLGNGKVVPVLHSSDLLKSALRFGAAPGAPPATAGLKKPPPPKTVLVVEDSFTSRSLLKHILQSAGYRVETAVDGLDALSALRRARFDVLVSDIDMPKLNGFDLTSTVRRDPALGHLPVVLVTALASPGDRARGMEVGANAYVVKSSFDQSNLLEVVKGLVE
jgi:two-component system chemotaxis sensor kinase CheA